MPEAYGFNFGFDHINRNAPVLIRTPKLTRFEPAQYWGGGPPGNSVVLNPFFCLMSQKSAYSSVGRAGDCSCMQLISLGRWFDSGCAEYFSNTFPYYIHMGSGARRRLDQFLLGKAY